MSENDSKSQVEFYVAKGEENFGPWTIDEIAERIAKSELSVTDFVYDESRADWISLLECEALKERLRRSKPKAPPPSAKTVRAQAAPVAEAQASAKTDGEWFVQKGAQRYGPFAYLGLVHALQEKSVYDFDFVWKEGMETWVRIAEHEDFQPERIRELSAKVDAAGDVFFRRQYPRVKFESEVIVHDDRSVWMGQAFEASVGGSGLVIENSTLSPGQVVRLHFAPCDGLPAFNALGEIVGKRYTKEVRGSKSPVRYAVRFLKLDGSAEPTVREYFEQRSAS